MCMAPKAPKITAPPPPAPAPEEAPAAPALNEKTTASTNESLASQAARKGRSALRIDLQTGSSGSGLNIPT